MSRPARRSPTSAGSRSLTCAYAPDTCSDLHRHSPGVSRRLPRLPPLCRCSDGTETERGPPSDVLSTTTTTTSTEDATMDTTAPATLAADQLRALLRLPAERPGCWEAEHIDALHDELTAILRTLAGDARR